MRTVQGFCVHLYVELGSSQQVEGGVPHGVGREGDLFLELVQAVLQLSSSAEHNNNKQRLMRCVRAGRVFQDKCHLQGRLAQKKQKTWVTCFFPARCEPTCRDRQEETRWLRWERYIVLLSSDSQSVGVWKGAFLSKQTVRPSQPHPPVSCVTSCIHLLPPADIFLLFCLLFLSEWPGLRGRTEAYPCSASVQKNTSRHSCVRNWTLLRRCGLCF